MTSKLNKTQLTNNSVASYIQDISAENRRLDCVRLDNLIQEITGFKPILWGSSMVGYGSYHYKYTSGYEGDSFLVGFSSRKAYLTIYITAGITNFPDLMGQLGIFKTGVSCLYIKSLADINIEILKKLIQLSVQRMQQKHPA